MPGVRKEIYRTEEEACGLSQDGEQKTETSIHHQNEQSHPECKILRPGLRPREPEYMLLWSWAAWSVLRIRRNSFGKAIHQGQRKALDD